MPKRFHGRWCSYETSAHLCGAQSDFGGRLSQVVGNRTKNDSWLQKTRNNQVRCWAKLHPKKFVLLYFPPEFVPQKPIPKKKPIWLRDLPIPSIYFRRMVAVITSRGWHPGYVWWLISRPKDMEVWFRWSSFSMGCILRFQALIFNWCKSLRRQQLSP